MADTPTHAINYWSGKCQTCLIASTAPEFDTKITSIPIFSGFDPQQPEAAQDNS